MKTFHELMVAAFEWADCHNAGLKVVEVEKRYTLEELAEEARQLREEEEEGEEEDEEDGGEEDGRLAALGEVDANAQSEQKRKRPSTGEKGQEKDKASAKGKGKSQSKGDTSAKKAKADTEPLPELARHKTKVHDRLNDPSAAEGFTFPPIVLGMRPVHDMSSEQFQLESSQEMSTSRIRESRTSRTSNYRSCGIQDRRLARAVFARRRRRKLAKGQTCIDVGV